VRQAPSEASGEFRSAGRRPGFGTVALAAALASVLSVPAGAAAQWELSTGALVDDASGYSFDIDARVAPTEQWSFAAGIGRAESSDQRAALTGDAWRASVDWQGAALGFGLGYRSWRDSSLFSADTLAADVSWSVGGGRISALVESRQFEIGYTITLPLRTQRFTQDFVDTGLGLAYSYYGDRWGGYVRALSYEHDAGLDRVITASRLPNLADFPRLQALLSSFVTRSVGSVDHHVALGVERSFSRSGVTLDLGFSRDAVTDDDSRNLSVSYRYALTPQFELEGLAGVTETDRFDALAFAGLQLRYRN